MKRRNPEVYLECLSALLLALAFAYVVVAARHWPFKAALFPTVIGVPGMILSLVVAVLQFTRRRSPQRSSGGAADLYLEEALLSREALGTTLIISAWIFGLFVASWLLGQKIALTLFVLFYLKAAGESWRLSIALTLATGAFLIGVFDWVLHSAWHEGVAFQWLGLQPF